jgi:hypothetical protein
MIMDTKFFIMQKLVDKSVLVDGFNIPFDLQELVYSMMDERLNHGESKKVKLILGGEFFEVTLTNINFNRHNHPDHGDLLQVRYSKNSPFAIKIRQVFSATANYVASMQALIKGRILIPDEIKEQFNLFSTPVKDMFYVEPLCAAKHLPHFNRLMTEEDFELNPLEWVAQRYDSDEQEQISKIRAIDHTICNNLKQLYDYHCQVTGEYLGKAYGGSLIEAHHIDYYVNTQNNSISNIIILSPNFHRIVHQFKPEFDHSNLEFRFPNGTIEKVRFNKHL